jgi:ankyrin repeat protein
MLFYTQDGWTALHWAAVKGHAEIVELLIKKGADLTIKKKVSALSTRLEYFRPFLDDFLFTHA